MDYPPFAPFEWMLALRYLRARRRESFISVISMFSLIGVALGVATLIVVMSVMNGFHTTLLDRVLGFSSHIKIFSFQDSKVTDFENIAATVREVDGVTRVAPYVEGQVLASAGDAATGVLIRGLTETDLKSLSLVSGNIIEGTLDGFGANTGIAIGYRLARILRVQLGDPVELIAPHGAITPFGMTPRIKSYPVTAIFSVGMSEYDAAFAFLPLAESQAFFNLGDDAVTAIEVMVADPGKVGPVRRAIENRFTEPMYVVDWRTLNKTYFDVLQVENNVMFIILTLIIVVASFNIISGLIMLVKDKGQDIAVLRSMGVTKGAIMRVFLITGSAIGIVGTVAGVLLGITVSLNIENIRQGLQWLLNTELFPAEFYYLAELPSQIEPGEVTAVAVISLTISFLATLYPSWRAARLDPVEALRYE